MASVTDIANAALMRCGDSPIISLTENNERARAVNAAWPLVRREVLRAHPWNCATQRAKLAALAVAPSWGFETAYEIPADCLRILEVNTTADWRVEGNQLVTDDTGELGIRYLKDETDASQFDGLLTECMVLRLAAEIVERIVNSHTKREMLLAEYEQKLDDARFADGAESSPAEFEEDLWLSVRA